MTDKTTLLIDADVVAYKAAIACEKEIRWDDEIHTLQADIAAAKRMVADIIETMTEATEADEVVTVLSASTNFRFGVLPTYKSNRIGTRKPVGLSTIREYIEDNYYNYIRDHLEGDDVLGILATHPTLIKGRKIVASIDKDLKTIPGFHYNFDKPELGIYEVSEEEADAYHMQQTLSGDTVDGYSGCPGIGTERAIKIVENPTRLDAYEHTFTRGARKGETEIRWRETDECPVWQAIVDQYEKAGLTGDCALQQARVARILRASDYDFKTKQVKLWNPIEV